MCCDVGLVSELRLTAGCVLMDLASLAISGTSVYANGLMSPALCMMLQFVYNKHSDLGLGQVRVYMQLTQPQTICDWDFCV
jgi:hypothetical protein